MRILLSTPAMGGMLSVSYFDSFLKTMALVNSKGHQLTVMTPDKDGLNLMRNTSAAAAINHKFDKLFFVDADIVWRPEQFLTLIESDKDIVGGTYPHKSYPISLVFNPLTEDAEKFKFRDLKDFKKYVEHRKCKNIQWDGEIEVRQIPTGFLCISVKALLKLTKNATHYIRQGKLTDENCKEEYDFFRNGFYKTPTGKNSCETEDFGFCNLARESGFKIFLHSKALVDHLGTHRYSASM